MPLGDEGEASPRGVAEEIATSSSAGAPTSLSPRGETVTGDQGRRGLVYQAATGAAA